MLGELLKGDFRHQVWGLGGHGGREWAQLIACRWVPNSFPLTHMVYLLLFSSYRAGSKSISARPFDQDTMTNTTPEAAASSSSNEMSYSFYKL